LLINDSALYDNLAKASADLDSLLIDVKANPGRYVQVSLWERKEKKRDSDT
jgi:phospholipid/cholesterol/gamma-HCH transport system substrate-binding protein